ncbi:hypothetical protein IPG41_01245 [Candidatus Peregrinibacteria bacterium]|nr:MAG: hypothetical protein IPG41_01245 [Candidatus Peregrinibacteria bacterium]
MTFPSKDLMFFKFILATSVVVYGLLIVLLEKFILSEAEGGFTNVPSDPLSQQLLLIFAGVAVLSGILQFALPARIKNPEAAFFIRLALCESIALLGFFLYLLSGFITEAYLFIGVSFLLILFGNRAQKTL